VRPPSGRALCVLILALMMVALLFAANAAAATLAVGNGIVGTPGETTTVSILLDNAPDGLSGYTITASLSDPAVGDITQVEFPSWATLNDTSGAPGDSVRMKGVDLHQTIEAGASNVTLAILTIRGDVKGACTIEVGVERIDDDHGNPVAPVVGSGTLAVGSYELRVSSSAGGSVTDPGEGVFTYTAGDHVSLVASPAAGCGFAGWVGSTAAVADTTAAATTIVMNGDYSITGAFLVITAGESDGLMTVTLTADPVNVIADGSSPPATLVATVQDAGGSNAPDGTPVTFTTDRGRLGTGGMMTATTTNGIATVTLTAPTEPGIATVQAQVDTASAYAAVFFKLPGQPDVIAVRTESTQPGTDTVAALDVANATVTKSGDGTPTVTVARSEVNPGGPFTIAFAGGYICVHLDDISDVEVVTICLYYPTTVDEGKVELYWWDDASSAWVPTSPQALDTTDVDGYGGKICTTIFFSETVPTLAGLQCGWFAVGERPD